MADQMSDDERLAEILWTARKRALGDDDDGTFATRSARIRKQYANEAAEVAKLLGQVRDAEVEQPGPEPTTSARTARSHARLQRGTIEWLRGELAHAEADVDRLAEQVRALANTLKGAKPYCSTHISSPGPTCPGCRDVALVRAALDGTEADRG